MHKRYVHSKLMTNIYHPSLVKYFVYLLGKTTTMKRYSLLLLFLFSFYCHFSNASNWFQIGTKWTWDYTTCCAGNNYTEKWIIEKDTLINSDTFKILTQYNYEFNTLKRLIIKEQNKQAFRYYNEQLLPICDFSKQAGDTVVSVLPNFSSGLDTIVFKIDSILPFQPYPTLSVQYIRLIRVNQDYNTMNYYTPRSINERTLFYGFEHTLPYQVMEPPMPGLRCYEDGDVNINTSTLACDKILATKDKRVLTGAISLYPNPVYNQLQIKFNSSLKQATIAIWNSSGSLVKHFLVESIDNAIQIETHDFPTGLYVLKLQTDNEIYTEKFTVIRRY